MAQSRRSWVRRAIASFATLMFTVSILAAFNEEENSKTVTEIDNETFMQLRDRAYPLPKPDDLAGNISAGRSLPLDDLVLLLSFSDILIDKGRDDVDRHRAGMGLRYLGHQAGIPALLAVLRDENDNLSARKMAVVQLTYIRDPRVVSYLIEDGLGSSEPEIVMVTLDCLDQFAGHPPKLHDTSYRASTVPPPGYTERAAPDPEELEEYLDIWREWWEREKDNIELNRSNRWVD